MSISPAHAPASRFTPRRGDAVIAAMRARPGGLVFALYLLAAIIVERDAMAHLAGVCACNAGSAYPPRFSVPTAFMWALKWWPHAIVHLQNPLVSHDIWTPQGLDLARATSVPIAALVVSPLTALFGPVVTFNLLTVLGPATGAWAAYRLCLYVSHRQLPSVLGGYLYGFSSYELAHLLGLVHTTLIFCAPVCVLLALKRLDEQISTRRYVVWLALTLIVQLLLSTELFLTLTMMAVASLLVAWLCAPADRGRLRGLLAPTATAYCVAAVLCAVYLYYALARGSGYSVGAGYTYVSDALNFVIPTRITWLGGTLFASVTNGFTGEIGEQGAYLGLPLLAMLVMYFIQARRTVAARILLGVIVVAGVWSLGAKLHVKGPTRLDLPAIVFAHLPVFDELAPARIALYLSLVASVAVALWLSRSPARPWRWGMAALAVLFLIPATNATYPGTRVAMFHSPVTVPRFISGGLYRSFLRRGEVILPLPWANQGAGMLWQARADFYFRMASGHFGAPPAAYRAWPVVTQLRGNRPGSGAAASLRSFIAEHSVGAIVQDPAWSAAWTPVIARLGLTGVHAGGLIVYRIPTGWLRGTTAR
jgi:hypothetical protein